MSGKMLAELISGGSGTDQVTINFFELKHKISLPLDYKNFLLLANGGELRTSAILYFKSDLYQGGEGNAGLDCVYAIDGPKNGAVVPLTEWITDTEIEVSNVPPTIFIIGEDIWGNQITIDLGEERKGQIGFVGHETLGEDFEAEETYQVIAQSFTEFVSKLESCE